MQAAFQPQVAGERDSVRPHRRPRIADYNFRASSAQAKARKRKQMKGKIAFIFLSQIFWNQDFSTSYEAKK
jgi:hypothetical protein